MSLFRRTGSVPEASLVVRSLALGLPSGHRIDAHEHGWAQLVFAARGVLAVEDVAKRWIVPPHRGLWVPAGVRHAVETVGEARLRTIYLRPDLAAKIAPSIRVLGIAPLLRELVLEIVRRGMLSEAEKVERSLATVLVALLIEAPVLELELPLPEDPRAREVAEAIRNEPGQGAVLPALTAVAGASPRTIERLFARETGLSFGRWRQRARLQHAVRRLANGVPVADVALECGYDSPSAFVTMFRRALGTTPGRYIVDPSR